MRWLLFIGIFMSILVSAQGQADEVAMTEEWFETRPVCFGRYIVDVPKILQPTITEARLDGFNITNLGPATRTDFENKVARRRLMMEAGGPVDDMETVRFHGAWEEHSAAILAYDFASRFDKEYVPPQHNTEAYVLADGYLFQMKGMVDKGSRDIQIADVLRIAHAIRPRNIKEMPAGPGYCFQDGFVALSNARSDFFGISMRNEKIDANFTFFIDARSRNGLTENEYHWPPEATKRTVAGFDGMQAWGVITEDNPDFRGYAGEFYGYHTSKAGEPHSSLQIRAERNYAEPYSGSFSFHEAQRFWESTLESLKLRE